MGDFSAVASSIEGVTSDPGFPIPSTIDRIVSIRDPQSASISLSAECVCVWGGGDGVSKEVASITTLNLCAA